MNRRDFSISVISTLVGFSLPLEFCSGLTIVDYKLLDDWNSVIKIGRLIVNNNNEYVMEVSFEESKMWDYVRLIDSEDREWYTDDKGTTWRCGLMEFSLDD